MSSPGAESRGTAGPPQASGRNKGQEAGAGRREQVRDLVPILGQVRTLLIVGRKGAAKVSLPTGFSISHTSVTI